MTETTLRFGPDWLRALSNGGTGGGGGAGAGGVAVLVDQDSGGRHVSVYSREELLALFEPRADAPGGLCERAGGAVFVERCLPPVAFSATTQEEQLAWQVGVNSEALLRLTERSRGATVGVAERGRSGRGGRGAGGFGVYRSGSYEDQDGAVGGGRSYVRGKGPVAGGSSGWDDSGSGRDRMGHADSWRSRGGDENGWRQRGRATSEHWAGRGGPETGGGGYSRRRPWTDDGRRWDGSSTDDTSLQTSASGSGGTDLSRRSQSTSDTVSPATVADSGQQSLPVVASVSAVAASPTEGSTIVQRSTGAGPVLPTSEAALSVSSSDAVSPAVTISAAAVQASVSCASVDAEHPSATPASGDCGTDSWYYTDPQNQVQGPFSSVEMMDWYRSGYFAVSLLVRRQCDTVFTPLGQLERLWGHVPFLVAAVAPPITAALSLASTTSPMMPVPRLDQQHHMMMMFEAVTQQKRSMVLQQQQQQSDISANPQPIEPSSTDIAHYIRQQQQQQRALAPPQLPQLHALSQSLHTGHADVTSPAVTGDSLKMTESTHQLPLAHQSARTGNDEMRSLLQQLTRSSLQQQQQAITPSCWPGEELHQKQQQHHLLDMRAAEEVRLRVESALQEERQRRQREEEEHRQRLLQERQQLEEHQRLEKMRLEAERRQLEEERQRLNEERLLQQRLREEQLKQEQEQQRREKLEAAAHEKREAEVRARKDAELLEKKRLEDDRNKKKQEKDRRAKEAHKRAQAEKKRCKEEAEEAIRVEEQLLREEQQRKAMEEEAEALRQLELRKRQRLRPAPPPAQPAWNLSNELVDAETEPPSLDEIQRLEDRQRQQQVRLAESVRAQQLRQQTEQQRRGTWSGTVAGSPATAAHHSTTVPTTDHCQPDAPVQSLAEIQAEQGVCARQRQQAEEELQRQQSQQHKQLATGSVWSCGGAQALSWKQPATQQHSSLATKSHATGKGTVASSSSAGFWDTSISSVKSTNDAAVSSKPTNNVTTALKFSNPPTLTKTPKSSGTCSPATSVSGSRKTYGKQRNTGNSKQSRAEKSVLNMFAGSGGGPCAGQLDTATEEFHQWSSEALAKLGSEVDVPTFIGFLQDVESPFDVQDYVRCYLGESREAKEFCRQFMERRSRWRHATRALGASGDPMSRVSSRIAPSPPVSTAVVSGEFQEVRSKNRRNKHKARSVDHSILGFSVTSPDSRGNVGERDSLG